MELQWPLILFTTLLAWAAGVFGAQCLYALRGQGTRAQMPALITSAALLVVGGIAVFFHLEHWERIFNGFGHLTSGITQELIAIIVLFVAMVVYFVYLRRGGDDAKVPTWLAAIGLVLAVVLVAVMGHSYMMASLPAWDSVLQIGSLLGAACGFGPATMAVLCAVKDESLDYTAKVNGTGGADPTVDKGQLISRILETIAAAENFLAERDFSLQTLVGAKDFEKLQLIQTAANAVSSTIEEKKTFQTNAAELIRLMKYADRGDIAPEVRTRYEAITAIYGELKKKRKTASNVDLMVEINNIISEYVHVEDAASGMVLSRQFDISQIDFDLLRREFAKTKKKNLVMKDLAELIRSRLDSMLLNNPDRIIYHERYQQIIEDYNSQQDRATIEKTFDELMQIVKDMDQEERRYVREGFSSDEELSLYDMLFSENLSKPDIRKIKAVAVELLQKVKSKIAELDHWTDKQETRSIVYNLIRDDLWSELPACYDDPSIPVYLQRIYEYVYKRYKEVA